MNTQVSHSKPQAPSFERAEFESAADATPRCGRCRQIPRAQYYTTPGSTLCKPCADHVRAHGAASEAGSFLRALAFGLLAAVVGSVVWYGITALTGYEIGLIGIVVGLAVGAAVRHGSGGRGGWMYQSLAMLLIYLAIVTSYVPLILAEMDKSGLAESGLEQALRVAFSFGFALFAPFLAGLENAIGIFIIGISVYEGWKLNKRIETPIEGPFPMPSAPSASTAKAA